MTSNLQTVKAELEGLMEEFRQTEFPDNLKGVEVNSTDLILLDADTMGYVTSAMPFGKLDSSKAIALKQLQHEIEDVLPELDSESKAYFEQLLTLATRILRINSVDA